MYEYSGIDAIMNEFYRCVNHGIYYQICISLDTFDCWCIPHVDANSFVRYDDPSIISIWGSCTWTEQRLIDEIDEAVAFNVEV